MLKHSCHSQVNCHSLNLTLTMHVKISRVPLKKYVTSKVIKEQNHVNHLQTQQKATKE